MKRMKQKDWLQVTFCCPVCRGKNIETARWDSYEYERICEDCKTEFSEIYKPVGYRITKKGKEVM
jgi:hypothetical protein